MRSLRVFLAGTSAIALAVSVTSAVGCARGEGEQIVSQAGDASDAQKPDGHVGVPDSTMNHIETGIPETGSGDTFVGLDQFVAPPPDAGFDAGADAGFDSGLVFFGNPGTTCSSLGAVQAETCGVCGTRTSTCIVRPDGGVPFHPDAAPPIDAGAEDAAHEAGAHDGSADGTALPHDAAHDSPSDATNDALSDAAKDAVKDAPSDAGPALVWGLFGACTNEIDGGCVPGTTTSESCGFCGTQMVVCEPDCELGATSCTGQVDGGCAPGTVDFIPDPSCADAGGGGKEKTCAATCMWSAESACVLPPSSLAISPTIAGKVDTFVDFIASHEDPLLDDQDFCPTTIMTSDMTPYGFVTFHNASTTQTATVSVWTSQVSGQPQIDTAITSFAMMPTNFSELKNCVGTITDMCFDMTDPTSCLGTFGGLMFEDGNAVTIAPGGSVVIFVQDQFNDPGDLGTIMVTARTESLQ